MAKKFLSYDPLHQMLTSMVTEDGKNHIIYEQDVQEHLDSAAEYRANEQRCKDGIKEGFWHVAFIPASVIMKMWTEDGVNFYDEDQGKRVRELIQTKYPACKTTNKRIA